VFKDPVGFYPTIAVVGLTIYEVDTFCWENLGTGPTVSISTGEDTGSTAYCML